MKTKSKSKEVIPSNTWYCDTCKTKEMTHQQMLEHLQTVHKLVTRGLKCSKSMVMHMDGDTWFSSQYEIIPEGTDIHLTNSTVNKRSYEDAMLWA